MGNLQNGLIDWNDLVYTSDADEIEKYQLESNDILFNRTNSPELVGKTVIYKGERPALFAGYLVRVNQIDTIVLPQYLCYFLNSHIARAHGNTVKTDGVNQSNINGSKLQDYPFPFCCLDEQAEIVSLLDERLSVIDAALADVEVHTAKANALRQSILKRAFSGQLVAQDPADEPASVLLARLGGTAPVLKTRRKKTA
jgi:type I restriction enzyme S subunit